MTIKEFLKEFGMMIYALITQPFIILYKDFKLLLIKTDKMGRPKFLHKFFFFLFVIYAFWVKDYHIALTFLICTIISTLKYNWDSKMYKHWLKERKIARLKKKYPELVKKDE